MDGTLAAAAAAAAGVTKSETAVHGAPTACSPFPVHVFSLHVVAIVRSPRTSSLWRLAVEGGPPTAHTRRRKPGRVLPLARPQLQRTTGASPGTLAVNNR
jgi:hypothetical protein